MTVLAPAGGYLSIDCLFVTGYCEDEADEKNHTVIGPVD